ncbi:MAG: GntR family transcriptional regulator [Desulfobulbaceae bacterium]|nr:GntR family transcriptional regulator [Desulfobulbaceae bacterium]
MIEPLHKINKPETLAQIAYKSLRNSILSFKLKQNIIYNEMSVAQELGLSRTPVREALLRLSSEGLVTFLPRKGFIVTSYTEEEIEEVFELRIILESSVIRKVASKISPGDFDKLREYIEIQHKAATENDYHGFMLSDRAFHKTFFELAGNCKLMEIMENFQDICHMIGVCYLKVAGFYEKVILDHEAILKSVETGDADKAEAAIVNHINRVKDAVIEAVSAES